MAWEVPDLAKESAAYAGNVRSAVEFQRPPNGSVDRPGRARRQTACSPDPTVPIRPLRWPCARLCRLRSSRLAPY